jgi:hypothetical protein
MPQSLSILETIRFVRGEMIRAYFQLLVAIAISAGLLSAAFSWADRNSTQAGGAEDTPTWRSIALFVVGCAALGGPIYWAIGKL